MFYVRSDDEEVAAVGADVVGSVLGIIFDDEDERIGRVGTVSNLVDQQSGRVVIVGHLQLGRIYSINRRAEAAEMVVGEANHREGWESIRFDLLLEFTRPLFVAKEVGECVVVPAEAKIGDFE